MIPVVNESTIEQVFASLFDGPKTKAQIRDATGLSASTVFFCCIQLRDSNRAERNGDLWSQVPA